MTAYTLPKGWTYDYRPSDGRYVLFERHEYRGDFPTMEAMFAWLKERGEL